MRIVVGPGVAEHVRDRGGRLWVWLDPHMGLGAPAVIYLIAATEPPGASKATRKLKSARRRHRFRTFESDGFEVLYDPGKLPMPDELHLVRKRIPKPRVDAYWNGAIWAGEDIPPPSEW